MAKVHNGPSTIAPELCAAPLAAALSDAEVPRAFAEADPGLDFEQVLGLHLLLQL